MNFIVAIPQSSLVFQPKVKVVDNEPKQVPADEPQIPSTKIQHKIFSQCLQVIIALATVTARRFSYQGGTRIKFAEEPADRRLDARRTAAVSNTARTDLSDGRPHLSAPRKLDEGGAAAAELPGRSLHKPPAKHSTKHRRVYRSQGGHHPERQGVTRYPVPAALPTQQPLNGLEHLNAAVIRRRRRYCCC